LWEFGNEKKKKEKEEKGGGGGGEIAADRTVKGAFLRHGKTRRIMSR